jgi:hypothetical protein
MVYESLQCCNKVNIKRSVLQKPGSPFVKSDVRDWCKLAFFKKGFQFPSDQL